MPLDISNSSQLQSDCDSNKCLSADLESAVHVANCEVLRLAELTSAACDAKRGEHTIPLFHAFDSRTCLCNGKEVHDTNAYSHFKHIDGQLN